MRMGKRESKYNRFIYLGLVVLCLGFFWWSSGSKGLDGNQVADAGFEKVQFVEDSREGGEKAGEVLIIKGHVTKEVEAGSVLFMRIFHIGVQVYQNETEIFAYGTVPAAGYPSLGDLWTGYTLKEGISPEDEVEFRLSAPAQTLVFSSTGRYEYFFDNLYVGSWSQFMRAILVDNIPHLLLALFFITNSIVIWLGALALKRAKLEVGPSVFNGAYLFLAMGLWMLVNGYFLSMLTTDNGLIMSLEHVLSFLMAALMFRYLSSILKSRAGLLNKALEYVVILMLVVSMLLQGLGILDGFAFLSKTVLLILVLIVLAEGSLIYEAVITKEKMARYRLLSAAVLLFFIVLGVMEFLFVMPQNDMLYDLGFFIFACMQLAFILYYLRKKLREAQQARALELELSEARTQLMISQIRPHFIFNTLNAISALCLEDPIRADEAIVQFSKYLRANITVLEGPKMIPFPQELEIIENYVAIEKLRFDERIAVEYEIEFTDFKVPMLSLQPIVENAIKHGLVKKKSGGKIIMRTEQADGFAVITITDNGVGFDTEEASKKEESVGMRNIRTRISISCQGELLVASTPGAGTQVTVRIPLAKDE
ncbi:two-component system LytT family sensor kinase [Lachnospiraceae bacterium PFB1-21]